MTILPLYSFLRRRHRVADMISWVFPEIPCPRIVGSSAPINRRRPVLQRQLGAVPETAFDGMPMEPIPLYAGEYDCGDANVAGD